MKEQPSAFEWIIELIGIMLSAGGVLFLVMTIYTFPFLALDFVYKVPPIVHVLMDYNDTVGLEHVLSDKTWVLLVFVSLVLIFFGLSKIINNLLEKQLRRLARRHKARRISTHIFVVILAQFTFFLLLAAGLFFMVFHL